MSLPVPYAPKNKGVTLIELLIVMSIISVIGITTIPLGANFLQRNALRNKTNELVTTLSVAKINSISGKEDSQWGVNVDSNNITLFRGASFAARDTAFDEVYIIPASLNITPFEVVFSKNVGDPSTTLDILLSNNLDSKRVTVNEVGTINLL